MIPHQTQQVLDFLGDPASYAHHPAQVTLHQTHASWVFVASPYVFKIKKPVNFGFMDFTSLAQRKANCDREVTLNRRLTEDIYLGVEAISLRNGKLHFVEEGEGANEIVEWAVKMRAMDSRDFLSHRIRENRLDPSDLDRVIERLVEFYRNQPPLELAKAQAASAHLRADIAANYPLARRFIPSCISEGALTVIEAYTRAFEANHKDLLNKRITSGAFRDCHGDLHLEHIHLAPGHVNIYDCTEFNDAFREIDMACDIAFLAMDLDFNRRTTEAKKLVTRVAEKLGDPAIPLLVDYYKCYRACVRGKVEALTSAEEEVDEVERLISQKKARRYFQLAVQTAIAGSTPLVVVVMGDVGSGKSTLASALAAATGWSRINSDILRKDLAGVPHLTRGTPQQRAQLYSQEMTLRVYQLLRESALEKLRQGDSIILDATFSKARFRDELNDCLASEKFKGLWIEATAPKDTRLNRLQAREYQKNVVSDARAEDFLDREFFYEPPTELSDSQFFQQSTEIDPDYVLFMALTGLSKLLAANNQPIR